MLIRIAQMVKSFKWIIFLNALQEDRTLKAMLRVVDTLAQDPEYKFSDWASQIVRQVEDLPFV